jgi:glutamate racemase
VNTRPIGIFDSGVGGLTVVDKVSRLLPNERIIYFGDTARVPYGNKSPEAVTRFSKEIVKFLLKFKVKLIIVACNTASSLSLDSLKRSFRVPILGVVKPGTEEALKITKPGRIGVIGTEATISSNAYRRRLKSADKSCFVAQKACPLFVSLAENNWLKGDIAVRIAKKYLRDVLEKRIDTLILGCTHYPLLKNTIRKVAGKNVKLVDSSASVAKYTKRLLEKNGLLNNAKRGSARFFVSDDTKSFAKLAKVFLGKGIKAKKVVF